MQTLGRWDRGVNWGLGLLVPRPEFWGSGNWRGVPAPGQCVCLFCRKLILTANDKQQWQQQWQQQQRRQQCDGTNAILRHLKMYLKMVRLL